MKPTTVEGVGSHGEAIYRGWTAPAGSDEGPIYSDRQNDSGGTILEGSVVVVVDDGTIELATTGEVRPIGIALDDIDDGDSGPVQFQGPVDLILVTASVTAGEFAVLSATPGQADADATPGFALFTTSGTEPEGFLYGHSAGSGIGGEPTADAHIADTSDAHDASAISVLDTAGFFTGTDAEAVLAEFAAKAIGYQAHGNMGSTETFSALTGWHSGTFNADCTFTFSGATSGIVASMILELLEDGTGGWEPTLPGSVVWPGGSAPTHDTTAGTTTLYLMQSRDGGTTWYGFQAGAGGGSASPLTTKGDLYGYDTADARIPVGANGYLLVADSTDAQGVVWENPETTGHYEILMTGASPAEPLEDGSGTDWLYVWVP